jgi:uncharacterized protein (TIGR00730 family)
MNKINKLAVFCGSKEGRHEIYVKHAQALGHILGTKSIELIFGGGKKGLMGAVADAAMSKASIVRGVIPKILTQWEHQHEQISELLIVDDMHIRKRTMYQLCDAAVILPGGFGTLDELFEVLTWNQLSIHDKKVFILNSNGFYNHLLAHMSFLEDEGFLYGKISEVLVVINEPEEILSYL